jgi:hypothetical protein
MMIQKKIYGLMIQRLSIALLMMALSVSTMRAAQTIKVDITGVANATWSLTVDGASVTFTNGVASVSDKADKLASGSYHENDILLADASGNVASSGVKINRSEELSNSPDSVPSDMTVLRAMSWKLI